ncbi:MAG: YkgJ family cysteine cluster protein [Ardenticatenaceae bacterium]|nr:YkgJ family cysteine cluster protein [Ardenticatenaceae bacterium]
MEHICLQCGACCAYYRVAFYWAETATGLDDAVPHHLTEKLDPHRLIMQGTRSHPARCLALEGKVGTGVTCTIYANRPSPCRELKVAWEDGTPSEQCDKARRAWGLPPIPPPILPQPQVEETAVTP